MNDENDRPPGTRSLRLSRRAALGTLAGGLAGAAAPAVAQSEDAAGVAALSVRARRRGNRTDPSPFCQHVIASLPGGLVLVIGGMLQAPMAAVKVYDPQTGVWTEAAPMNTPRQYHAAAALPDGRVLVAGGRYQSPLASAEVYDPERDRWTFVVPMNVARQWLSAVALPGNRVLAAGGWAGQVLGTVEIYHAGTDRWTFGRQQPAL